MDDEVKSGRPERGEFAEYAAGDIAAVEGDSAAIALVTQFGDMLTLLQGLDEQRVRGLSYAAGKWTFKEVIGHVIDDERIFAYRALCVARNDTRALPGFDENQYVAATRFEARTLASLSAEYAAVRSASILFFTSLDEEEWLRRGTVNGYSASVRGLAFHLAAHELHHLRILREHYLAL